MAETKRKYAKKKSEALEDTPQTFTLISSIPYLHVEGYTFNGNKLEVNSREIVEKMIKYKQITEGAPSDDT